MMSKTIIFTLLCLLGSTTQASPDDLVLFVHPDSEIKGITKSQIIKIYMGKYDEFPSGTEVSPFDTGSSRTLFYRKLIRKSLPQLNAYWSRIKFTGRAENKPPVIENPEQVLAIIADDKHAIGYMPRKLVKGNFRIVYEFN